MEKMLNLFNEAPEVVDAPDAKPLIVGVGEIAFEDVSFIYDPEKPASARVKNVSFTIPGGKTVALVGATGSGTYYSIVLSYQIGKSTLLRLLFRFYDFQGGCVKIDGQDIRNVTQSSLRQAIGVVPQDTVLFNDTVKYNIAYGNPEASDEAIYHGIILIASVIAHYGHSCQNGSNPRSHPFVSRRL